MNYDNSIKKYKKLAVVILFLITSGLIIGSFLIYKYTPNTKVSTNTTTSRKSDSESINKELKKSPVLEQQIKTSTTSSKIKIRQTLDYEIIYDKDLQYFQVIVTNATTSGSIRQKVEDYFQAVNTNPNNLPIYYYIKK